METINNKKFIIFVGRSGSGKGTQSKLLFDFLLKNDIKSNLIVTGDIFRQMMKKENDASVIAKNIYNAGGRHPDFLAITMLGNYFQENFVNDHSYIIDGAARSYYEAETLYNIAKYFGFEKAIVVYMNVSYEWSIDKLIKRDRDDDNKESFEKKKTWFENEVIPAIRYFENNSFFNFIEINAEKTVEEIHKEIVSKIL